MTTQTKSHRSALNLAQHIGQWLTSEDARVFFKKSTRRAGIFVGGLMGLDEQDRAITPAIAQVRAGVVSAAIHHPVSIHLFMLWGLLGVMWTAASEHPKRSEAREKALERIFDPEEYRDLDQEIAEDDSGEPQVLKIYNRNIRAFKDPLSLTDEKTQEVRPLNENEELFNTNPTGERSKGIWFLIARDKTLGKGWEELYESTTSHSHRRIRARAKCMYEQHFADSDDKSQYNLWVNNCQTFATFLAIAITEPEEQRTIVDKTLTSRSTFWVSGVGSVFASIYFYWCKKVIEEVKPHLEKRSNSAFWSSANKKLTYIDQRWDYYYLHPQVMLQRQQFLNQALGPKYADKARHMTSTSIEKMKEINAKKHEIRHHAQDKYRRWKSLEPLKRREEHVALEKEDEEQKLDSAMNGPLEGTKGTDLSSTENDGVQADAESSNIAPEIFHNDTQKLVGANASAGDKPKRVNAIFTKQSEIDDKKQEVKSQIKTKFRRWRRAENFPVAIQQEKTSVEQVSQGLDSLKGLALVEQLGANDDGARDDFESKLNDESQESVHHDATDMATAELMAQLVTGDWDTSSESLLTGLSLDSDPTSTSSSIPSDEVPSPSVDIVMDASAEDVTIARPSSLHGTVAAS